MEELRIGSVSYLNARPLVSGLPGVVLDVPSRLTERFRRGEVDVALLPVFEALADPARVVVPGISISSPGPVDSVLLFSRGPLGAARHVLLDDSSLTSAALVRVLFAHRLGAGPVFERRSPETDPRLMDADALLLIGDRALTAPRDGLAVTDVASLWREWTGLPFCFAVWLARDRAAARRAGPVLRAAKERGLARRREIAEEAAPALGLSAEELHRYLVERVTYDLGEPERAAVARFEDLCRDTGLL